MLQKCKSRICIQQSNVAEKKNVRANSKGALSRLMEIEGYIRNLNTYLRTGVYLDLFYGADQEKKIQFRTIVPCKINKR